MAEYEFVTVDVFTDTRFGGNPLAVFPDASGLGDGDMQRLARELNLSETTFVLPPDDPAHDARVRIFTPVVEMPFAGHPNVGTAYVLGRRDPGVRAHYLFEEPAGLVRVDLRHDAAGIVLGAEVAAPLSLSLAEIVPLDIVARCVGLGLDDVRTDRHVPMIASVGAAYIVAELRSLDALRRAAPDHAAFRAATGDFPAAEGRFQIHLYWRDPSDPERVHSRMFAPLVGVAEDPATGSAAVMLAAVLLSLEPVAESQRFTMIQGVEMGRPSLLLATARRGKDGAITASVAGSCVPVLRGWAEV